MLLVHVPLDSSHNFKRIEMKTLSSTDARGYLLISPKDRSLLFLEVGNAVLSRFVFT